MKELKCYTDEFGMIGHIMPNGQPEFGDSPQRTFSHMIYRYLDGEDKARLVADFLKVTVKIHIKIDGKSQYRRHWHTGAWTGEPWTMSRDQFIPMLIAASLISPSYALNLDELLAERYGFAWNYKHIWPKPNEEPKLPDWINPIFRLMVRKRSTCGARLILELCDLELIVMGLVLWLRSKKDASNTSDDLNFQLHAVYALTVKPTWSAKIARLIYRWRVKPKGFEAYSVPESVQRSYFSSPGAPPMYLAAQTMFKLLA